MKIVTDCAADIPPEELELLEITEVPLYIQFPEGEVNSADITPDEFYDRLEAMQPAIPTTSLPSEGVFAEIFNKLAQASKQIISLHLSSGLSGTFNSAKNGSLQVKNTDITTVDTMTLSGGQRFQVLAAAKAVRAGWNVKRILEHLVKIRAKTEVIYTLETLDYLSRGGRIGRVQALAGSLLKIKPVIHVDKTDGKYSTIGKNRTMAQSMMAITDHLKKMYESAPVWVTVLHGRISDSANSLAKSLEENLNVRKMEILRISPVLGVHTGPGIVGAAVLPITLMDEITSLN